MWTCRIALRFISFENHSFPFESHLMAASTNPSLCDKQIHAWFHGKLNQQQAVKSSRKRMKTRMLLVKGFLTGLYPTITLIQPPLYECITSEVISKGDWNNFEQAVNN